MKTFRFWLKLFTLISIPNASFAGLDDEIESFETYKPTHRFSITGGITRIQEQNSFSANLAYEYRFDPALGVGGQISQIFSPFSLTQLALPGLFLHLARGDWYIFGSPLAYVNTGTIDVGARVLMYIPLKMKYLRLSPTIGADIIQGGPNYIFGLGFSIGN